MKLPNFLLNPVFKDYVSYPCVYPSDYMIAKEGDQCNRIGVILEGSAVLVHHTVDGKSLLLGQLKKGDVFGDFLIHSESPVYPGYLETTEQTTVIYIEKEELEMLLVNNQEFRNFYLTNLSSKALRLNTHNRLLTVTTIKDKILFYLDAESKKTKNGKVRIKSKASLARYLGVERPSLVRVLSQLKKDGVLDFNKHEIWLII